MNIPLTPLDGRYYERVKDLVPFLSEHALIHYRLMIEVEWLRKLMTTIGNPIDNILDKKLRKIGKNFTVSDSNAIKEIEAKTNHDVKSVEIWLGQFLESEGATDLVPYVHFGRTSEDINNLAYAFMLKGTRDDVMLPAIQKIIDMLAKLSQDESDSVLLSRTHGQPATPTTLGKELAVFRSRLREQAENIASVSIKGKCNGATGTYAADSVAYPDIDWPVEMKQFVESLGLSFNPLTTQIEPHDWIARLNNEMALASTICIDLARDCWQYISAGHMTQKVVAGEVGSSTMPHKVNPIDFENAEANFGISNALLNHLSAKLPISRLQRDLSDSSAMRSLSEAYGHMLIGLKSLAKGLSRVSGNSISMRAELDQEWAILTEAIQTIMRKNGIKDAYDHIKSLSRGTEITKEAIQELIQKLDINEQDKKRLVELTPASYIGYTESLAKDS